MPRTLQRRCNLLHHTHKYTKTVTMKMNGSSRKTSSFHRSRLTLCTGVLLAALFLVAIYSPAGEPCVITGVSFCKIPCSFHTLLDFLLFCLIVFILCLSLLIVQFSHFLFSCLVSLSLLLLLL